MAVTKRLRGIGILGLVGAAGFFVLAQLDFSPKGAAAMEGVARVPGPGMGGLLDVVPPEVMRQGPQPVVAPGAIPFAEVRKAFAMVPETRAGFLGRNPTSTLSRDEELGRLTPRLVKEPSYDRCKDLLAKMWLVDGQGDFWVVAGRFRDYLLVRSVEEGGSGTDWKDLLLQYVDRSGRWFRDGPNLGLGARPSAVEPLATLARLTTSDQTRFWAAERVRERVEGGDEWEEAFLSWVSVLRFEVLARLEFPGSTEAVLPEWIWPLEPQVRSSIVLGIKKNPTPYEPSETAAGCGRILKATVEAFEQGRDFALATYRAAVAQEVWDLPKGLVRPVEFDLNTVSRNVEDLGRVRNVFGKMYIANRFDLTPLIQRYFDSVEADAAVRELVEAY